MDRGVWGTIVNGVAKESGTSERAHTHTHTRSHYILFCVAKQTKKIILNGFLSIGSTQRRGEQDFMLGSSKLTAMQI